MPTPSLFQADPLDEPLTPPRRSRRPPPPTWHKSKLPSELDWLLERCPQLDLQLRELQMLLKLPAVRPDIDWVPSGKSPRAAFLSLAKHHLALFPVPAFLWSVLFERPRTRALFLPLLLAVARGESLFDFTHAGDFPVPLTRAQCHALLASPPEMAIHEALRRVQAHRLPAWMTEELLLTEWGRELFRPGIEAQWTLWIDWLATRADVRPGQVGPLTDFVIERLETGFVLKGRTAASLHAAMESWHEELARHTLTSPHLPPKPMPRSGFQGLTWSTSGGDFTETWNMQEIVDPEALFEEGVRMHHCVFTYMNRIWEGTTSIWSLGRVRPEGRTRLITLQVRNADSQIVQIRGPCNRQPTAEEMALIRHWAAFTGLSVAGAYVA